MIMMMVVIAIESAYFDSVKTANESFIKLRDNILTFEKETYLLNEAKCYLANYETLDDFEFENAYSYPKANGYVLSFEDIKLYVETSGKMYLYCFNFEEMRQHDPVVLCLDLRLTFVADRKYKIKYDDFVKLSRKTPYKDVGTQELNLNKIIKNVN